MRTRLLASASVGLALVCALPLTAQNAQSSAQAPSRPVFRAGTAIVPVDVRVVDKDGQPVTNLSQADFTVTENGKPQDIGLFSVEALTAESPSAVTDSALPHRATGGAMPAPRNYRVFLIVLGRGRIQSVAHGVDGLVHLVRDRLLPQDRVAVLAWNRSTDFTTDHGRIADLLERFKQGNDRVESDLQHYFTGLFWLYGNREIPDSIQREIDAVFGGPGSPGARTVPDGVIPEAAQMQEDTNAAIDLLQTQNNDPLSRMLQQNLGGSLDTFIRSAAQTGQDLGNLYAGIAYLREIEGEKHLLWVSEDGMMLPRFEDDQTLAQTASDARIVIDIIRTGGTPNVMAGMNSADARRPARGAAVAAASARAQQPATTSRTLADQTGGRFDNNKLPNASVDADYISAASSFQYLLGYYPSNPNLDGRYRNIAVRVNRPGVTVMYRHGYFARRDLPPLDARAALTYSRVTTAAQYGKPIPDLALRGATATPRGTDGLTVTITLDLSRVTFTKVADREVASVDLAVFCFGKDGHEAGLLTKTIDLDLTGDRYADLLKNGLSITAIVPVTAPPESAKIIAYDYDADLLGSVSVKVKS